MHEHHHNHHRQFESSGPVRRRRDGESRGGPRGGRRGGHDHGEWKRGGRHGGDAGRGFLGRGPRAARGDVRAAILALVSEEPMHGYQIIRELGERSGGVWSPSPGSIYPTLQLLSDEGLVESSEEDGRRVYSATAAGRAVAAERGPDRPAPWDEVAAGSDSSVIDLRSLAVQVITAAKQVAQAGSQADVEKVKAILTDARRSIYRVLADSEPSPEEGTPQA